MGARGGVTGSGRKWPSDLSPAGPPITDSIHRPDDLYTYLYSNVELLSFVHRENTYADDVREAQRCCIDNKTNKLINRFRCLIHNDV